MRGEAMECKCEDAAMSKCGLAGPDAAEERPSAAASTPASQGRRVEGGHSIN